jgi:hypothetical protein
MERQRGVNVFLPVAFEERERKMSDFNRNDDLYNRDRDLRVVQQDNDSGLGLMAGIAVVVLLLLGGLLFYFNPGAVRTADSGMTSADSSISSPATTSPRSPMSPASPAAPSATPSSPTTPPTAPAR